MKFDWIFTPADPVGFNVFNLFLCTAIRVNLHNGEHIIIAIKSNSLFTDSSQGPFNVVNTHSIEPCEIDEILKLEDMVIFIVQNCEFLSIGKERTSDEILDTPKMIWTARFQ